MAPTIRLGRLFGIEIGLNWSLIFIFVLIAWTLASAVLPQGAPHQPAIAYWGTGVIGALVFYGCLLGHELAHALMARRQGVKVAGITLWLFGGVSQLQGEPQTARSEALITAVGPITSLGLALVAFLISLGTSAARAPILLTALLDWLAFLNLALGLFNLLPAFPLDGGRLLSALLWLRSGTRQRGLQQAARVGRVVAALMIAFGLVEIVLGNVVGGVWLAFIGWFLLSAGGAEERGVTARELLRSVPVSAAMTAPVVTVPDWITVDQFLASIAHSHRFTTYPLHNLGGQLTGVVRLPDLVRVPPPVRGDRRLIDVAHPLSEIPTATPQEELTQVLQRVGPALDRRVLVFDGGNLVGILSPADISRLLVLRQSGATRSGAAPSS